MWARQRAHPLQGAQCQGTNISKAILRQSEAKNAIGQWVTQISCRRGKLCAKTTTKARLTLFEKNVDLQMGQLHTAPATRCNLPMSAIHTQKFNQHIVQNWMTTHNKPKANTYPPAGERARAHREARKHACAQVHTHTQARAC